MSLRQTKPCNNVTGHHKCLTSMQLFVYKSAKPHASVTSPRPKKSIKTKTKLTHNENCNL